MKTTFRDLWPNAISSFFLYLVSSILLGSLAAFLEATGAEARTIVLWIVALVLPVHFCIYAIKRSFKADHRVRSPEPADGRQNTKATAAGGDES